MVSRLRFVPGVGLTGDLVLFFDNRRRVLADSGDATSALGTTEVVLEVEARFAFERGDLFVEVLARDFEVAVDIRPLEARGPA